jgi:hypothetical protein
MSPSFIWVILLPTKNSLKNFTQLQPFQILEIVSMFDECSPVIIVDPGGPGKSQFTKMVPVVEADQLLQVDSFFYLMKI